MIIYILISFSSLFAALDSVIIQPGPEEAQDCQIINNVEGTGGSWGHYNKGNTSCMAAGEYDENTVCRSLLKFSIPANISAGNIVRAEIVLNLEHWDGGDTTPVCPVNIYQMLRSWKQGNGSGSNCYDIVLNSALIDGVTGMERFWGTLVNQSKWNAPNVGIDDVDAKSLPEITVSKSYLDTKPWVFDVTILCTKWVLGTAPNYGVLIRNPLEHGINGKTVGYPIFCTGDNTVSPQKRPLLKILYDVEKDLKRTASDSITIQPGPEDAQDCQIVNNSGGTGGTWGNYNNGKVSCMGAGAYDLNTICRSLLKFSTPAGISADSIVRAEIVLNVDHWKGGDTNPACPVNVYHMLRSWKSGNGSGGCDDKELNSSLIDGATGVERFWGNQDGLGNWNAPNVGIDNVDAKNLSEITVSKIYSSTDSWTFDITSLCKKWVQGTAPNHGVLLRNPLELGINGKNIGYPIFCTGDYTVSPQKRPFLKIVYNSDQKPKKLAHWPFDTISNDSTIIDKEGRCNIHCSNVTISPSPSTGGALECTSDSFKLEVKNSKDSLSSPNFSVECLVYFNQASPAEWSYSQQKIYSFENLNTSGLKEGYSLTIWRDGRLGLNIAKPNSTWADCISQDTLYPKNWYYVVGSYDGTNMKVYVNGKLSNTVNSPGGYVYPKINASVASQTMDGIIGYRLNGKLDELSIYNYALNSDIILKNYTLLKPKEKTPFKINFGMKTAYAKAGDTVCMPIILTNFETFSINACQFEMHFDTTFVSLIKISKEDCLIKDWALFDWNYRNGKKDSVIVAMGGAKLPLQYGDGELVKCYFVVKPGASKGDSCIISLSNIDIDENQNIVNPSCQNGKILINKPSILYGDLTGNGEVTALDAVKVLNYAVGILQLPDSTVPNFTQPVADVSGNTIITCYDAALIFQYSLGLIPTFPVQTKVLKKKSTTNTGKSAFISIISHNNGLAGAQYDIVGSNLKGCISVDMELACDSNYHFTDGIINSPIKSATTIMNLTNKKTILVGMSMPDNIDEDSILTFVRLTLLPTENQQLPQLRIVSISLNEGNIPVQIQNLPVLSTAYKNQYPMKPSMSFNNKTITISNIHSGGEFQLWSLNGKLVYKNSYTVNNNHSTFIKLNALRKGIYLYRLNSGTFTDKGSFIFNK